MCRERGETSRLSAWSSERKTGSVSPRDRRPSFKLILRRRTRIVLEVTCLWFPVPYGLFAALASSLDSISRTVQESLYRGKKTLTCHQAVGRGEPNTSDS